jgi:hypothetical protein
MLGFAVVAAYEAAVALQPGQAGLDDPAVPAEAAGGFDALAAMRTMMPRRRTSRRSAGWS